MLACSCSSKYDIPPRLLGWEGGDLTRTRNGWISVLAGAAAPTPPHRMSMERVFPCEIASGFRMGMSCFPLRGWVGRSLSDTLYKAVSPVLAGAAAPTPLQGMSTGRVSCWHVPATFRYDYPAPVTGGGKVGVQPTPDRVISSVLAGAAAPTPPHRMSMVRVSCWHVPATFQV